MKNFKKHLSVLMILIGFTLPVFAAEDTGSNVKVIDENNINITLDSNIGSIGILEGDYKLFENISVNNFTDNDLTKNSVILELDKELSLNSKYSLLSIIPIDGEMEFILTGSTITEQTIDNSIGLTDGVKSIKIIDSYTVEVMFHNEVNGDEFDFSILKELKIDSIKSDNGDVLNLDIIDNLSLNTNYILMFISLKDTAGNIISIGDGIYDFNTPTSFEEEHIDDKIVLEDENIELNSAGEDVAIEEEHIDEETVLENENLELNSAGEEAIIEEEKLETPDLNIEEVAMGVDRTPDTGAKEILLVILASIMGLMFLFVRQKA